MVKTEVKSKIFGFLTIRIKEEGKQFCSCENSNIEQCQDVDETEVFDDGLKAGFLGL